MDTPAGPAESGATARRLLSTDPARAEMNEMGPPPAQADEEPPTPAGETLTPDGESACLVAATSGRQTG